MSDDIKTYAAAILADVADTERNGSPTTDHLGSWKEPGRLFRSDPCRYCGGRHHFSDCMAGNPQPGLSLAGIQAKWDKHSEALVALRAAIAEEGK
jgi:hypothetical protein